MKTLTRSWAALFFLGWALILIDAIAKEAAAIAGVPALTAIGAALVIMVITSWLTWRAKIAWEERTRVNSMDQNGNASG